MSYIVNWTEETKSEAIRMLTAYLIKHGDSESIYQNKTATADAIYLVSEVAEQPGLVKYNDAV